jgi:hypothetical protein
MGTRIIDATIYIADDDTAPTSDNDYHTLVANGSTLRLCTPRVPASNATGYQGELCIGTVSGTTYLYCHNGTQWLRTAFGTY